MQYVYLSTVHVTNISVECSDSIFFQIASQYGSVDSYWIRHFPIRRKYYEAMVHYYSNAEALIATKRLSGEVLYGMSLR